MAIEMNKVEPQWAWSPYVPDDERPWNRAAAAHLYRRAGFGANHKQLDKAAGMDPHDVVQGLVTAEGESDESRQQFAHLAQAMVNTGDPGKLAAAWLYHMLATSHPLREKMTLFWHGHFATSAQKVQDAKMMLDQNELLRRFALGDFHQLVLEISRDPAMLIYLDSTTNRKAHPNENYAREVMELFCLGEGNYTEKDIQELARCFTGWEVKRKKFRFNRFQHDFGEKSILGNQGKFAGEDGVRLVLEQPSMPRFIVGKLIRFFICDEPRPSSALVEPLAQQFRDDDLDVLPTVQRILGSQLFFSRHAIGRKVCSPVELAVGLLRALEGSANMFELDDELAQVGQRLFYPPNVKGWDGGRTWINSSTLLGRANLVHQLLNSDKTHYGGGGTLGELAAHYGIETPEELVEWLSEMLLAVPIPSDVRQRLVDLAGSAPTDDRRLIGAVIHAMSTLPEFQLA